MLGKPRLGSDGRCWTKAGSRSYECKTPDGASRRHLCSPALKRASFYIAASKTAGLNPKQNFECNLKIYIFLLFEQYQRQSYRTMWQCRTLPGRTSPRVSAAKESLGSLWRLKPQHKRRITKERKVGLHSGVERSKKNLEFFVKKLGGPLDKELSNYLQIWCEQRQGNLHGGRRR